MRAPSHSHQQAQQPALYAFLQAAVAAAAPQRTCQRRAPYAATATAVGCPTRIRCRIPTALLLLPPTTRPLQQLQLLQTAAEAATPATAALAPGSGQRPLRAQAQGRRTSSSRTWCWRQRCSSWSSPCSSCLSAHRGSQPLSTSPLSAPSTATPAPLAGAAAVETAAVAQPPRPTGACGLARPHPLQPAQQQQVRTLLTASPCCRPAAGAVQSAAPGPHTALATALSPHRLS